jgi:hypothetical protein
MIAVCNARRNNVPFGFGLSWRAKVCRASENDLLVGDFCRPSTLDTRQQFAKSSFSTNDARMSLKTKDRYRRLADKPGMCLKKKYLAALRGNVIENKSA